MNTLAAVLVVSCLAHQPIGKHVLVVQADSSGVVMRPLRTRAFDLCRCCGWVERDSMLAVCKRWRECRAQATQGGAK